MSDGAVSERTVSTNGVKLHVLEAGPKNGLPVVLCHGFPELAYSWRHQLPALGNAGYHVIAPDQRGYGQSTQPENIEDYDILHLTGDLVGLLDALDNISPSRAGIAAARSVARDDTLIVGYRPIT